MQEEAAEHGCYTSRAPGISLLDSHGILLKQITQWCMVIIVPILTILFSYAGVQAWRTHREFSFDSNVLFLCAIYNAVFFVTNTIRCSAVAQYIDILLVTAIILYLYYNFETVI